LDHQVCKSHVGPNTHALIEQMQAGLMSSKDHSLEQINGSVKQAMLDLRGLKELIQLRTALRNDGATWTNTCWFTISVAPHSIELDWRAATAIGAVAGIDNGTRGTYYFGP